MGALRALDARYRLVGNVVGRRVNTGDPELISASELWHLATIYGPLDLLYDPIGGGYDYLIEEAFQVDIGDGYVVLAASLEDIITSKTMADRPKDRQVLPDLLFFRDQYTNS